MVDAYLPDNGVFKANVFIQHIQEYSQRLRFCGVNTHHQIGIVERTIATVFDTSIAMVLC